MQVGSEVILGDHLCEYASSEDGKVMKRVCHIKVVVNSVVGSMYEVIGCRPYKAAVLDIKLQWFSGLVNVVSEFVEAVTDYLPFNNWVYMSSESVGMS